MKRIVRKKVKSEELLYRFLFRLVRKIGKKVTDKEITYFEDSDWERFRQLIVKQVIKNFMNEEDEYGHKWPALSKYTIAKRLGISAEKAEGKRVPILKDTLLLMLGASGGIGSFETKNKNSYEYGIKSSKIIKAAPLQFGAQKKGKAWGGPIPARRYLGLNKSNEYDMEELTHEIILDRIVDKLESINV